MALTIGCVARLFRRAAAAAGIGAALLAIASVPPCSAARQTPPPCCCDSACPGPAPLGSECCVPATASDPRTSLVSQAPKHEPARAITLGVAMSAAPLLSPLLWFAHRERPLLQLPPIYARIRVLRL